LFVVVEITSVLLKPATLWSPGPTTCSTPFHVLFLDESFALVMFVHGYIARGACIFPLDTWLAVRLYLRQILHVGLCNYLVSSRRALLRHKIQITHFDSLGHTGRCVQHPLLFFGKITTSNRIAKHRDVSFLTQHLDAGAGPGMPITIVFRWS